MVVSCRQLRVVHHMMGGARVVGDALWHHMMGGVCAHIFYYTLWHHVMWVHGARRVGCVLYARVREHPWVRW